MTMYPFDHIHRNWDKRLALHNKASELLAEAEKQNELALDIEDDDETRHPGRIENRPALCKK